MSVVPPLLLMGPTGCGKTALALEMAARFRVGLISVDSALVYRGLDIGAAKPDRATLAAFPHELVDIADPAQPYSTGEFLRDVLPAMERVRARGEVPLLVGGTMLWFRALQAGLADLPAADPALRAALSAEAELRGWAALHERLATLDPAAAARIHPNDAQRIQRALEVHDLSGQSLSGLQQQNLRSGGAGAATGPLGAAMQGALKLALLPADRVALHERLAARFHQMLADGLLDEVRGLRARDDLHAELPAVRAVGYRQLWSYLAGECRLEAAVEAGIAATRQLAKRQLTWLRREPDVENVPMPPTVDWVVARLGHHGVQER
jgi:tRNA dimethylallyltransferase